MSEPRTLPPRCLDVLFLIHTTRPSTKEIAHRMRLATGTVHFYIEHLRKITGCHSLDQLAVRAPGWLWPEGPPRASD